MITPDRFDNSPAPVRVLMSAHGFAKDVPPETQAELLARYHARLAEEEARAIAPKPRPMPQPSAKLALRQPLTRVRASPGASKKRPSTRKYPVDAPYRTPATFNPGEMVRLFDAGKPPVQIAAILGCTPAVIYSRLKRAGRIVAVHREVVPDVVYGRLTTIEETDPSPKHGRMVLCRCACGKVTPVAMRLLRNRTRRSCGCRSSQGKRIPDTTIAAMVAARKTGRTLEDIGREFGMSVTFVCRLVKRGEAGQ